MAGYGTDQDFSTWLSDQGLTLPTGSPPAVVLRQRGSDYVDSTYEPQLQCSSRTGGWDQERAWPRAGHTVGGTPVTGIPRPWVLASYRAAWLEASNPGWASGSIDPTRKTKREKVDVIEREFFGPGETGGDDLLGMGNVDAQIQNMVSPFFCAGSPSPRFFVI